MANIKKSAFIELRIFLLNVSAICFNKKKPSPSRGGLPKDNPKGMIPYYSMREGEETT